MKTHHGHVLLGAGAIHTGVLQDGILLEVLGITTIEETQHVLDGHTSIKDITSYEDVCRTVKTQLASFFVKQFIHFFIRIYHLYMVVFEFRRENVSYFIKHVLLRGHFHTDKFLVSSFLI